MGRRRLVGGKEGRRSWWQTRGQKAHWTRRLSAVGCVHWKRDEERLAAGSGDDEVWAKIAGQSA